MLESNQELVHGVLNLGDETIVSQESSFRDGTETRRHVLSGQQYIL